ncbi:hypothetical protein D3C81_1516070 [compost metagenome]
MVQVLHADRASAGTNDELGLAGFGAVGCVPRLQSGIKGALDRHGVATAGGGIDPRSVRVAAEVHIYTGLAGLVHAVLEEPVQLALTGAHVVEVPAPTVLPWESPFSLARRRHELAIRVRECHLGVVADEGKVRKQQQLCLIPLPCQITGPIQQVVLMITDCP